MEDKHQTHTWRRDTRLTDGGQTPGSQMEDRHKTHRKRTDTQVTYECKRHALGHHVLFGGNFESINLFLRPGYSARLITIGKEVIDVTAVLGHTGLWWTDTRQTDGG